MDDNTDIVDRLRSMYYELSRRQASTPFGERSELDGIPTLLYEAAIKIQDLRGNEIQRLRKERDEARRMVCEKEETLGCDERGVPRNGSARDQAKQRGWDCFKDNP
jgi:hypothetical protein